MRTLVTAASALALAAALTACSGSGDPAPASSPSTTAGSSAASSTSGTSTDAATSAPSGTTSGTASAGTSGPTTSATTAPAAPTIDQSTPEAAMVSWLGSMVAGDSTAVCSLMASGGKPITDIAGAGEMCATMVGPTLTQLQKVGSAFAGLTIKGATVSGDEATFAAVTTQPALAAQVVKSLKAARIGSKWYVTQ